ncbi:MAG: prepilin-type N-terminal cleavage/methylation domain-containing protein [Deltaproteobacteria bacterium]|nr:prepilin-type N-terminal cleavage/methylation domain-containing protein [Candidatus Anaeroferrophillacea bacterium]
MRRCGTGMVTVGSRRRSGCRAAAGRRGMTVVELIMVIVIIGALAVVAVPRLFRHDYELRGAADRLTADLRYCQELNLNRAGEAWCFGLAAGEYFLWRDDDGSGSPDAGEPYAAEPLTGGDWRVSFAALRIDSLTAEPAVAGVGFSRRGRPTYAGWSSAGIDFRLARGGRELLLHLEGITGCVHVVE